MATLSAHDFIAKWGEGGPGFALNEEQGAQTHFIELCQLLGVPVPGSQDGYRFEQKSQVVGDKTGYADVFFENRFAWENKAPGKNLDAALKQLRNYAMALANPPLLVVCDRLTIRIHTAFNGHPSEVHTVALHELAFPDKQALLRRVWQAPESFRPKATNRDITEQAAKSFATLAEQLRKRGHHADAVAHFLTQCLFCFFAEDVDLLPGRLFERMVNNRHFTSAQLSESLTQLFTAMRDGGVYGPDAVPWFNGGLFKTVAVPKLEILDITELRNAARLNWRAIDVSIFGTLFERGLDPAKRSQLGAHYTDPATIMRIIEPVVRRPLLAQWAQAKAHIAAHAAKVKRKGDKAYQQALAAQQAWLDALATYRVLDPACGSGNFLFLGLKTLKDIEHQSLLEAYELGLELPPDLVTGPHNMLGIELNEYAAELARVTVWIGELQWRIEHGYGFKTNPVLEPLDHIECRDALLAWPDVAAASPGDAPAAASPPSAALAGGCARGSWPFGPEVAPNTAPPAPTAGSAAAPSGAVEASWPKASVVIGNPPFLGDKWMRSELGDAYVDTLRRVYEGRVPGGADLVTYWFERARVQLKHHGLGAAGLVATNSIRQRANRSVLDAVLQVAPIFEAWSDSAWVNEGANVRVSLVCFGFAAQQPRLDGQDVQRVFSDLKAQAIGSAAADLTKAMPLPENEDASFFGFCLAGPFKVPGDVARQWLNLPNVNGRSSAEVLKPIYNGRDVTDRWAGNWAVDFGATMPEAEAALFEAPFSYAIQTIKPIRAGNREAARAANWWRHGRARPELRRQLEKLPRYIATVETAKHRVFVWFPVSVAPEHRLIVIPRADDATFGLLSSRFHVLWALARGGTLEDRPVYNTQACFEPFPFPVGLTPADTAHQQVEAVAGPGQGSEAGGRFGATSGRHGQEPQAGTASPGSAQAPATSIVKTTAANAATIPAHLSGAAKQHATAIALAAKRLNDLRENWLNPPEWTQVVPEVVPLGMAESPYPPRVLPKPGLSEADAKALSKRTLTNLYNERPAWLQAAHAALDAAVAAAYGWADYSADWPDEDILRRLLALNLERA
jgi:hypothetical protein